MKLGIIFSVLSDTDHIGRECFCFTSILNNEKSNWKPTHTPPANIHCTVCRIHPYEAYVYLPLHSYLMCLLILSYSFIPLRSSALCFVILMLHTTFSIYISVICSLGFIIVPGVGMFPSPTAPCKVCETVAVTLGFIRFKWQKYMVRWRKYLGVEEICCCVVTVSHTSKW